MALGRHKEKRQRDFWVATADLPRSEGHVFYRKLNGLLRDAGFDHFVETLCGPHYHDTQERPGIPPGVYFRMLVVGYFEGIGSQRGIACMLISLWTGRKPTLRTYEMICHYFSGLAEEDELLAHLAKLQAHQV